MNKKLIWLLFFLTFGLTITLNDGFMALDDYWIGIVRYIPAQSSSIRNLVHLDDVKSPLQLLPFYELSQAAYDLGIQSPYLQYRFMLALISILNIGLFLFGLFVFRKWMARREGEEKAQSYFYFLLGLSAVYFVLPFSLTRPMFESIAAPWLFLSMVFTFLYDQESRRKDLLWATFFVSVAFCLRPQLGICALALPMIALFKKKYSDLSWISLLGALFFILSGLVDWRIRGTFHQSLIALTTYNFAHGGDYGHQPWYYYLALLFLTGFIPFLWAKYPRSFVKEQLSLYRVAWIFLILFVALHNLFPQKWERFLLSIFPIFFLALAPFLWQLWQERSRRRVRWIALASLNLLFLFPASFTRPQNAILELALKLNRHAEVQQVYRVGGQPEWFPEAFVQRKDYQVTNLEENPSSWPVVSCNSWIILNEKQKEQYKDLLTNYRLAENLPSNWIDRLAFRLNPKKNQRRASFFAYTCNPEMKSIAQQTVTQ